LCVCVCHYREGLANDISVGGVAKEVGVIAYKKKTHKSVPWRICYVRSLYGVL
jgi:hypothetical protein